MNIKQIMDQIDILYSNQKVEEVEELLLNKIEEFKNTSQIFYVIPLMNELLGIYREKGEVKKGTNCCNELVNLFETSGFKKDDNYATTFLNIATAQRAFKNYDLALKYYNECSKIYENLVDKNDYRFACLYNNLSLLYIELGEHLKAINYLENSIKILETCEGVDVQIATAHTTISQIYIQLDNIELAKTHIKISSEIFEINEDYHHSATLSTYAQIEYLIGNYENSAELYRQAMDKIEKYIGKTENYKLLEENLQEVLLKINNNNNIKGLELSKAFYEEFGKSMIKNKFSEYENKIAVGIVGEGSECFGFDDIYSHDHDFGAGFCMWLTDEDYNKIGENLQEEYDKLPTIYKGIQRKYITKFNKRVGVFKISEFYNSLIQFENFPLSSEEWLYLKDYQLAHATNGVVFKDDLGEFSKIRKELEKHYPTDVWVKKIASEVHLVSQTGQYNLIRTLNRGDLLTSKLILSDFINHTMNLVHLLNKKYTPFYKWTYMSFTKLSTLSELSIQFNKLLRINLDTIEILDNNEKDEFINIITNIIENIVSDIIKELHNQGFIKEINKSNFLDSYIQEILTLKTEEAEILSTKIELVKNIIVLEWNTFDKVQGADGRAVCQNDYTTFNIMRSSQFLAWNNKMLESYLNDFQEAIKDGRNMITEKYAFMMKSTDFESYSSIKDYLPNLSKEHIELIETIVVMQLDLMIDLQKKYPKLVNNGRILNSSDDTLYDTSYETYLRGELSTYSLNTVKLYYDYITQNSKKGINIAKLCLENTAKLYGHKDLEEAEKSL